MKTLTKWKVRGNDIICAGSGAVIAQVNVGWPDNEIAAHARMLAAAPDMLKALKKLMPEKTDYMNWNTYNKAIKMARAAIAKGEGK